MQGIVDEMGEHYQAWESFLRNLWAYSNLEVVDVLVDGRSKFLSRIFLLSIVTVVPLDGDAFSVIAGAARLL